MEFAFVFVLFTEQLTPILLNVDEWVMLFMVWSSNFIDTKTYSVRLINISNPCDWTKKNAHVDLKISSPLTNGPAETHMEYWSVSIAHYAIFILRVFEISCDKTSYKIWRRFPDGLVQQGFTNRYTKQAFP